MKRTIHDFRVYQNDHLSNDYFVLYLDCPEKMPEILPGQFVQALVEHSPATYLRRPFSVYHVDEQLNRMALMIKVAGIGTAALMKLSAGDTLNLIYPLGNSFEMPEGDHALLIGGGVGIAPMYMLAKRLHDLGKKVDVLIGGRTSKDIIEPNLYREFGNVHITTDDGSLGEKGMVTQHSLFSGENLPFSKIYACGPDPMMRAVSNLAKSKGIDCEVSLENLMACGIGACLCCIVETNEGNKTSCVEGPVFNTRDLKAWQ
ncbi:MAG: dihydroorotate dehydrogenase electron transfer subunit [Bacteroidales bacterium]|nr:dihydroorotate dehydrogenase electron transfer subunit [Bacteroidales bacterium]